MGAAVAGEEIDVGWRWGRFFFYFFFGRCFSRRCATSYHRLDCLLLLQFGSRFFFFAQRSFSCWVFLWWPHPPRRPAMAGREIAEEKKAANEPREEGEEDECGGGRKKKPSGSILLFFFLLWRRRRKFFASGFDRGIWYFFSAEFFFPARRRASSEQQQQQQQQQAEDVEVRLSPPTQESVEGDPGGKKKKKKMRLGPKMEAGVSFSLFFFPHSRPGLVVGDSSVGSTRPWPPGRKETSRRKSNAHPYRRRKHGPGEGGKKEGTRRPHSRDDRPTLSPLRGTFFPKKFFLVLGTPRHKTRSRAHPGQGAQRIGLARYPESLPGEPGPPC